jgi:hypothetical protein
MGIAVSQDKDSRRELLNAVLNLQMPQNAVNFLTSRGPVSFSERTLLHEVVLVSFSSVLKTQEVGTA